MEIVGLLVIVVLIILILFFSLTFTSGDKEDDFQDYQDLKLSSQIGTVMLETHVECATTQRRLRDLAVDCSSLRQINCGTETSCQKLNNTIQEILLLTLDQDLDYSLTISANNNMITNFTSEKCATSRNIKAATPTPIGNTMGVPLVLQIRICN